MIFCEETILDYVTRTCGVDFAGIVGIGLINIYEDPSEEDLADPEFWANEVAQDTKKYFVIRNTRGEYLNPEAIQEEDLIGWINTGAQHSATIEVNNVKDNRDFWDWVKNHNWKIVIATGGGLLFYIDKPVSIYAKIVNGKSIKSESFFNVQMKWQGLSNPVILETPDGIFSGDSYLPISDSVFDDTFDDTFG